MNLGAEVSGGGVAGTLGGLTQFAGNGTAVLRDQDGYTSGQLQNFSIDRIGIISGAFTNGVNQTLGQIVLADFNNPAGLLRTGDNMYALSGNSGGAVLGYALEGSQSFVTSGALEMSNVDLAQEFTNLIVAQRGFQANSRVITTSDSMLGQKWARIWPLSALIRSMGAYFVRRNSKNELYRRVLERYIVDGDARRACRRRCSRRAA